MPPISLPFRRRNAAVAGGVLLAHAAALWALQHGLLRQQPPEIVVPVQVVSEIIPAQPAEPAAPPPAPPPPVPPPPRPAPAPVPRKAPAPRPAPRPPAPLPAAIPETAPSPTAPLGTTAPQPPAPPIAAPVAPPAPASVPAPPAPPAPAPVSLPMVDADYAANEEAFRPPAISRRLGEYGTVLLRVTVGVNGFATRVELARSSGYDRLDKAALEGARKLKFRPATRNGVPVEWTYDFPVRYAERTR
ncbi:energy transducer TonB [Ramlibacter tataouinensis]|uniref:energy transducer TonB n=1 Tax=Ramlibacter tataouinensis TaxID=94132 RepID=UPI0022F3AD9F|nr:energy transducer TonB [Ramlibacter tataouinensis]WBY01678.1 energy transducer TonB [Ramlibacter tataouinensis]